MKMRLLVLLLLINCVVADQACVGFDHSCRIRDDGKVVCVGKNDYGQLGINDYKHVTHAPGTIVVELPAKAINIVCSVYFTCVSIESDELYCWGINYYGQLGIGSDIFTIPFPFTKVNIPPLYSFCCGDAHCLAITQSYNSQDIINVYGWGLNNLGQLGVGDTITRGTSMADFPLPSVNLPPLVSINKDTKIRCAANGGSVLIPRLNTTSQTNYYVAYAWGDNRAGQLAYGDSNPPYDIIGDQPGEYPIAMNIGEGIKELGFGYNHSCALLDDNTIRCSGDNEFGQLGYTSVDSIGTTFDSLPPPPVLTGMVVGKVGFYRYHTCFSEVTNASVQFKNGACYGLNIAYQLGIDTLQDNIGYNNGTMPPHTFLLPQNFSYMSGPVPYLNSMGCLYIEVPKNDSIDLTHVYIGWGLDNYTLQANTQYVIGPQLLTNECGDKFVDEEAGEKCDNNRYLLNGQECTNHCFGLKKCRVGMYIPFTENLATYEDMYGCKFPTYKCPRSSPIKNSYCYDNGYTIGSWLIEQVVPVVNTTHIWQENLDNSISPLYILNDFVININQTLELFAESLKINNDEVSFIVGGNLNITGKIKINTKFIGTISFAIRGEIYFKPKEIILLSSDMRSSTFSDAKDKIVLVRIYKKESARTATIIAVPIIMIIMFILSFIGTLMYMKYRRQREYHPIEDSIIGNREEKDPLTINRVPTTSSVNTDNNKIESF